MTVARIESTVCAGWTYTDERGQESWLIVLRTGEGEWLELNDGGISYDRTAANTRSFIDEWIADADIDNGESTPYPAPDVVEVYRAAAEFIEATT